MYTLIHIYKIMDGFLYQYIELTFIFWDHCAIAHHAETIYLTKPHSWTFRLCPRCTLSILRHSWIIAACTHIFLPHKIRALRGEQWFLIYLWASRAKPSTETPLAEQSNKFSNKDLPSRPWEAEEEE